MKRFKRLLLLALVLGAGLWAFLFSLANSDPLGAGWFFKVKLSDASQVDALLDATAYEAFSKQG